MQSGGLEGRFVVRVDNCLKTYTRYDLIPNRIEDIIHFEPKVPKGPHSEIEHEEIEKWQHRLNLLIARTQ